MVSSGNFVHDYFSLGTATNIEAGDNLTLKFETEGEDASYSDDFSTNKYLTDAYNPVISNVGYDAVRDVVFSFNHLGQGIGNLTYKFNSPTQFYNSSILFITNESESPGANTSVWYSYNNSSYTYLNSTISNGVSVSASVPSYGKSVFYVQFRTNTSGLTKETPISSIQINYTNHEYFSSGNFVSEPLYFPNITYIGLKWNQTKPSETSVKIQLRESDNNQTWDAWSSNYTNNLGNNITFFFKDYIQYRAWLSTSNQSKTPTLYSVDISFFNASTDSSGKYDYNVTIPTDSLGILPLEVRVEQDFIYQIIWANSTNMSIWAATDVPYLILENFTQGANSNYTYFINFTRADLEENNLVNGTINITLSNSSGIQANYSCLSYTCTKSWLVSSGLRYGNYTVNISAHNESAYYRNTSKSFDSYLEERNTSGSFHVPNVTVSDYAKGEKYLIYINATLNNTGGASMIIPYVYLYDADTGVEEASEYISVNRIYPDNHGNITLEILLANNLNPDSYHIIWRVNWTNNDGSIGPKTGPPNYLQDSLMYVNLLPNVTLLLSSYSENKTIEHCNSSNITFQAQAVGSTNLNNVSTAFIEGNITKNTSNISSSWVSVVSTNPIPLIYAGQESNISVQFSVPCYTLPGNYTGALFINSSEGGSKFFNVTIQVPLNATWSLSPNANFTFNHSFSLGAPGYVANYTINNSGNLDLFFNIDYSPDGDPDYTAYNLIVENKLLGETIVNPTNITVVRNSISNFSIYQEGRNQETLNLKIITLISNSSATPVSSIIEDMWDIAEQEPEVAGMWFFLDGTAGEIAEQNKVLTIKIKAIDDVSLNTTATIANLSWAGGATSIPLTGLTGDPTQYVLNGGDYIVLNYSGNYTPLYEKNYSVTATIRDLAGNSITSGVYNFSSYGTTNITLSPNTSAGSVSTVTKYTKGITYVNYTLENIGLVTGYYPKLNFSTTSSYIKVNNKTFNNISSGYNSNHVAQINATELTPPGAYNVSANMTWTNPSGVKTSVLKLFTLTVEANASLNATFEISSLTTSSGLSNSSLLQIENIGNVPLTSVDIECYSPDCAYFTTGANDSIMSINTNSSKIVNVTFTADSNTGGGIYNLYLNVSDGSVYNTVLLQMEVLETKTWVVSPDSIEAVKKTNTSGTLEEILINNTGNVNMTYNVYSTNTSLFGVNESSFEIFSGSSKKILVNYTSPLEEGTYIGKIVITNDYADASPHQVNVTITLDATLLELIIIFPNQTSPLEDLLVGEVVPIRANLTYIGVILISLTAWNASIGDLDCLNLNYSFNPSTTFWEINCSAPSLPDGLFYDILLEADNELYGYVWKKETDAVSYLDISPPRFEIIQHNVALNDNINLQVNITDNIGVNESSTLAYVTYPNSTTVNLTLSLIGGYYTNTALPLDIAGEYIVNYTASDTLGNFNYSLGWFDVQSNYTWNITLTNYAGTPVSGVNFSLYKPGTTIPLLFNKISDAQGKVSFEVNKRNYDIKSNFSTEQFIIWNKNFSNQTYIQNNVSLNMYTISADNLLESIPLYKPFKGIVVNTTGFDSEAVTAILNYEGYNYDVPVALGIIKCGSWNYTSKSCSSSWSALSSLRNITTKTVEGNSTAGGVSAYFLAENKCGNGLCETTYGETTTTCSLDCKETTTTTTIISSGGGGGGGSGGLRPADLAKIEEMIKSFLNVGGVKVETTSIYKELFPGDIATFRVSIVNGLNTKNILEVKASGDVVNLLFFDSTLISLEPNQQSSLLVKVVVPKSLKPGNYDGDLVLMSGGVEGKIPVTIRVLAPEGNLLDVKIQPLSSSVAPGEILRLQTELINLGKTSKVDVQFDIQLMDINTGEILARTEEAFAVENTLRTIKEIKIPETIKTGRYMVKGIAYYSNTEADGLMQASSLAYIDVNYPILQRTLFGIKVWMYSLFLLGIAIITGIYYYFQYLEMRRRRFRVKVEVDKLPKAGTDSAFLGKIAETDIRAFMDLDKLKTHVLVAGSTGSGKTVAAQGIIEEALLHNKSVIVFDPTAQWSGFLKGCEDKGMLKRYSYFDMNTKSVRAFNGIIKTIKDPYEKINVLRYMDQPGEITVFNISQLTPQQMEIVVASTIEQIFQSRPEESKELKTLIIYDEVHRLLSKFGGKGEGFIQIERGAREFRKWGIGLVLISQVLSDFVGEIKANIGTEIQLGTRYEGDLERINLKYGEDMLKSVVKSPVGTGMFVNPEYNNGRPYFISFRPLLHSIKRLSDKDLEIYGRYFDIVEDLDYQVEQLKKLKVDAIDLELELRLIKKKIKAGQFTMADMYLESLNPMMASQWKKIGRSPQRMQKKRIEKEEIMKGVETAKREREKYIKSQKLEQINLKEELIKIYEKIGEAKRKGVDVIKIQGETKDFQDKAASFGGKVSNADAKELIKGLNILKKEVESLK
ncbi:MAG: DUF87 domain-containing protein [archaeon]